MTANILLVDDDEVFRRLTTKILEKCGYRVETAVDGMDAWEKICSDPHRFDLMLLDKQMPRLDGISLLRRVRADRRFDDLPAVMLTADRYKDDLIQGLAAGAICYLVKPAGRGILEHTIKNVLTESQQKRELRKLIGQQASYMKLLRRAQFSFKSLAEANDLALMLAEVSMNPARTLNGYQELLINAVEHGNLGITYAEKGQLLLQDRWADEVEARLQRPEYAERDVSVRLEKTASALIVTIADQGQGFDWKPYIQFSPERAFDLHGRGIAMSTAVSFDCLEYQGAGNIVVATVNLA